MKKFIYISSIALLAVLFLEQKGGNVKVFTNHFNPRVENINSFPYVAFSFRGHFSEQFLALKAFLDEIEKQQIIPTGPLFIVYREIPDYPGTTETVMEFCFPTAEGTMVKEPLHLKTWDYSQVLSLELMGSVDEITQPDIAFLKSLRKGRLKANGPVVVRVIDYQKVSTSKNDFQGEIWVPLTDKPQGISN